MDLSEIYRNIACEVECLSENEISDKLIQQMRYFTEIWDELPEAQKKQNMQKAVDLIDKKKYISAIYMYSVFTFHIHEKKWMEEMLEMILGIQNIYAETLYFLYWQISVRYMVYPECESEKGRVLHWKLFQRVYKTYSGCIQGLQWIEQTERTKDFVVVIIAQCLGGIAHGPSKTAFDRCKTLMKAMHKKVLLINTAEAISKVGRVLWVNQYLPDYAKELSEQEVVEWNGIKIPFFQCENNMPDINVLNLLIGQILKMKPQFIVEIGTGSILANLLSQCFPVLSVVTGFSRLSVTETQYQVSALNITDKERRILGQVGKEESHVIPSLFTFGLKEQQMHLNKKDLGLPEEKFLVAVIGMRLDVEVDADFLQMLNSANNKQIGFVFIGKFLTYEELLLNCQELSCNIYVLGETNDVLAVLELCDLFVNPIRLGGGTSAAEAMSKGLPVVSTSYGDVGATVGEDFWVKDYVEMAKMINRYQQDHSFYQKQSELAVKRAEVLLDTDGEFIRVIKEFGNRMGERYI